MSYKFTKLFTFIALALTLSACGGGSGNHRPDAPPPAASTTSASA